MDIGLPKTFHHSSDWNSTLACVWVINDDFCEIYCCCFYLKDWWHNNRSLSPWMSSKKFKFISHCFCVSGDIWKKIKPWHKPARFRLTLSKLLIPIHESFSYYGNSIKLCVRRISIKFNLTNLFSHCEELLRSRTFHIFKNRHNKQTTRKNINENGRREWDGFPKDIKLRSLSSNLYTQIRMSPRTLMSLQLGKNWV